MDVRKTGQSLRAVHMYKVKAFLELHLSNDSTEFAMWGS